MFAAARANAAMRSGFAGIAIGLGGAGWFGLIACGLAAGTGRSVLAAVVSGGGGGLAAAAIVSVGGCPSAVAATASVDVGSCAVAMIVSAGAGWFAAAAIVSAGAGWFTVAAAGFVFSQECVSNKKPVPKKATAIVAATTACETRERKVLNDRVARFLLGISEGLYSGVQCQSGHIGGDFTTLTIRVSPDVKGVSPKSQRRINTYEPVGDPAIKRPRDPLHFA